ncbi:MAG: hypothetical protein NC336_07690 [Clostridium sp.]|nr:hypothetical protein [Clostridium sp.]
MKEDKNERRDQRQNPDVQAVQDYPGAAINDADNDKVDDCLVKQRTKLQNNNPRSHGVDPNAE